MEEGEHERETKLSNFLRRHLSPFWATRFIGSLLLERNVTVGFDDRLNMPNELGRATDSSSYAASSVSESMDVIGVATGVRFSSE